jgi:lipopolysaccharide/colanic/teichoic acid biosynthesis glycosyltransferase
MMRLIDNAQQGSAVEACPWLTTYPLRASPLHLDGLAKRAFDVVVAFLALLFALPVIVLAAIAIKLTSPRGPVVFMQRRTGYRGQQFKLYKLRTMVPNAEAMKSRLAHLNDRQWPDFKIRRDPRVTRVGRILRMTSIDELPQFFNVLRGDMSLVGPRPTSLPSSEYARWQSERFGVRPGLTGLWQVAARDSSSFDHRLRLDIAYATRQSLRLDLEILARTVPTVLFGRGAT